MAGRGVLVPSLGDWEYSNDRAATEGAYTQVGPSGAEACNCSTCRNYVAVRQRVLPPAFVAFLHSVGIDPMKEGEAYHLGQSALGCHKYGGWFHFVGDLQKTGDFPMIQPTSAFRFYLCRAHSPHLKALDGHHLVEVGFDADEVPWVLNEPQPK
jgi:hypothetical protein